MQTWPIPLKTAALPKACQDIGTAKHCLYSDEKSRRDNTMPYYSQPERIPTLLEALNNQNVEQRKALARLLPDRTIPTRKAELVSDVMQRLQGKALQTLGLVGNGFSFAFEPVGHLVANALN